MSQAHPDDVLIVAFHAERSGYPQFTERQIVPASRLDRLRGRTLHRVWFTSAAVVRMEAADIEGLDAEHVSRWRPDEPEQDINLLDMIRALEPAVKPVGMGPDYGSGWDEAIEAVCQLLTEVFASAANE